MKSDVERFYEKIEQDDSGCWLWLGSKDKCGYAFIKAQGKMRKAHKWFYELTYGTVPEGLELDHLCKTPSCVNPFHLEPVTHSENMKRSADKPFCKKGHPRIAPGRCKICDKIRELERYGWRTANKIKTRCKNGHEYNEANTYHRKDGGRNCRPCAALLQRNRRRTA